MTVGSFLTNYDTTRTLASKETFVPQEDVEQLYTLNSVFLEAGLNTRWRNISLDPMYRGDKNALTLQRLRDPFIARRVKKLTFGITSTVARTVDDLLPVVESIISNALLLDLLINISGLQVPQFKALSPIFTALWNSKGVCKHLESLSVCANYFGFRELFFGSELHPTFPKLKSLKYSHRGLAIRTLGAGLEALVDPPAKFLATVLGQSESTSAATTRRVSSLESLAIEIYGSNITPGEVGGVLDVLANTLFENLLTLDLTLKTFVAEADSIKLLTNFLSQSTMNIQTLKVKTHDGEVEAAFLDAVNQNRDAFTQLTHFEYSGKTKQPAAAIIERCRSRLRTLKLSEFGQVKLVGPEEIIQFFDDPLPQLQTLSYLAGTFNKQELLIILQTFAPALLSLSVFIGPYSDLTTNLFVPGYVDKPSHLENEMCRELEGEVFTQFKLKNLGVWEKNDRWHKATMEALGRSIPSIENFFEQPVAPY